MDLTAGHYHVPWMKKLFSSILRSLRGTFLFETLRKLIPPKWKKGAFEFKGKFPVSTSDGKSFYLFNNDFYLETSIFLHGIDNFDWEPQSRRVWTKLCEQCDTIFDIGANTGIFSVLAKAYNSNAKVFAFEPQPNIYAVLEKNKEVNGYDMACENLAISNESGILPFYNYGKDPFDTGNTTAGSLNKDWRPKDDQQSIDVTVVTLQSYIQKHNIKSVDLMKIDVESMEHEVLEGYGQLLPKHQPLILLEVLDVELGARIGNMFAANSTRFYYIDEKSGLVTTEELGTNGRGNYLICPESRADLLNGLL